MSTSDAIFYSFPEPALRANSNAFNIIGSIRQVPGIVFWRHLWDLESDLRCADR